MLRYFLTGFFAFTFFLLSLAPTLKPPAPAPPPSDAVDEDFVRPGAKLPPPAPNCPLLATPAPEPAPNVNPVDDGVLPKD